MNINGTFNAILTSLDGYAKGENGVKLGRRSIEKTWNGELKAKSKGEMVSAMTPVKGSAGYVAIEQVTGTLAGKKGSFVLQHYGIMDKGKDRLILEVVPDSGTDELQGLTGKLAIRIEEGTHFYDFEYEL